MNIEEKIKEVAKQFAKFGRTMDLNDAILALVNEAKESVRPEKNHLIDDNGIKRFFDNMTQGIINGKEYDVYWCPRNNKNIVI